MKALLRQIRWLALVSVAAILGVFIIQNAARVELQVFLWTLTSRRAFLVLTCVALGFVLGWMFGYTAKRR